MGIFYFKEAIQLHTDGTSEKSQLRIIAVQQQPQQHRWYLSIRTTYQHSQPVQLSAPPPLQFQVYMAKGVLVKPETPGMLHCLGFWLYYLIIFPFSRKQLGWPDHDFYLLFLGMVPQGFLLLSRDMPQIYSDGETWATSTDLLSKPLVCSNILWPWCLSL